MTVEPITQWKLFRTRFGRHRLAMLATVVLLLLVIAVLFAGTAIPGLKDPFTQFEDENGRTLNLLPPRGQFPFGTDQLGRDVMSRVVYGGRTSLVVAGSHRPAGGFHRNHHRGGARATTGAGSTSP